jgi:hypothetical protein
MPKADRRAIELMAPESNRDSPVTISAQAIPAMKNEIRGGSGGLPPESA